ncbi:MAG TPA: exo-alpha-sialidase [Terriglobia bacterium]|nr:exo-alpha-sialidase [Terriglobia bacterium]
MNTSNKTLTQLPAVIITVAFLLTMGCSDRSVISSIEEVTTPATGESEEPNLSVGPSGDVYLSWLELSKEGIKTLKFAMKTANGWSEPRTISQNDTLLMNYADFPSVLELPNSTLAAHWLSTIPERGGYNVSVAISRDKGQTWSEPVTPHRDGAAVEHGFVSLAPAGNGVAVIWLDSRKLEKGSDDVSLMTTLVDPDGKLGTESEIDERVCECCQPSSVAVQGGFLTVYRDRSKEEIRDIVVTRFDGKEWSPPKTVFEDRWQISACPIQGPAIAAAGEHVAVAWFTAVGDKPKVQVALSEDGGKTFGPPTQVDEGDPIGRVDVIALESGGAVATWIEHSPDLGGVVRARQVSAGGDAQEAVTVGKTSIGNASGFPRVERSGASIVFAWTDTDEHRIRTAVAR